MSESPLSAFAPDVFNGRVALVTGGGRGIGRAIALGFARLGADVAIASRNEENLVPTARDVEMLGRRCLARAMNIRKVDEVEALVAATIDRFGKIDFLVNNAGGQFPAKPFDISDNGWRAVVDLNLNGTWNMTSRVGRHMVERGFGAIVNIVHLFAFERGAPDFVHSGAARAGVVNMTRSLAFHWARRGVTINAIAPGTIDTAGLREEEFAAADSDDFEARNLRQVPSRRWGDVDEVAAACMFLCSPAARFVNGIALTVDGAEYYAKDTLLDPDA